VSDVWTATFSKEFSDAVYAYNGNSDWVPQIGDSFTIKMKGVANYTGTLKFNMIDERDVVDYWSAFAVNSFPDCHVEEGEEFTQTALREVLEETGATASIVSFIGTSVYTFNSADDVVSKEVHWYLMCADSYYCKPQKEEYFFDAGFYKFNEAYHLLKFSNEKEILYKAYEEYVKLKKEHRWMKLTTSKK